MLRLRLGHNMHAGTVQNWSIIVTLDCAAGKLAVRQEIPVHKHRLHFKDTPEAASHSDVRFSC